MKKRIRLYPHNRYSASARVLANALGAKILRIVNSRYVPRPTDKIINWGSSHCPYPQAINASTVIAINKLDALTALKAAGIAVPYFTTDKEKAQKWNVRRTVLARKKLRSSGGDGIVVCPPGSELPNAPLYVRYIPKKVEYRVHVWNGTVILCQQKRLRNGMPHGMICSHQHGWVFTLTNVNVPQDAQDMAVRAVAALNLTFGAVDLILSQTENKSFILEVNTAPGIAGETTVEAYKQAILHAN